MRRKNVQLGHSRFIDISTQLQECDLVGDMLRTRQRLFDLAFDGIANSPPRGQRRRSNTAHPQAEASHQSVYFFALGFQGR